MGQKGLKYRPKSLTHTVFSGIDHALLRQANHSIMTYGSFGMWGALLNQGGEIVIPKTHTEYETLKYMLKANLSNIVVI